MDTSTALWSLGGGLFIGLAYFAGAVFIVGLAWRLWVYFRTPAPLRIPITPAPETTFGVLGRMSADVTLFPNLFKADKALWVGSWLFHVALFFILFRHLRYFTYPVPNLIITLQKVSIYAGFIFPVLGLYLFWRRLALPRVLYISRIPDFFPLLLLAAIAATGILLKTWAHVYLVDVKAFILGLLTLKPVAPPLHPLFLLHFTLVLTLLIYFPFSKLMHAGGIFFSPTRNQAFNVKERHVNPWGVIPPTDESSQ